MNDNTFTEINKRIYTIEDNLHLTISDYNADLEFFGITSHSTSEAIKLSDSTNVLGILIMNFSNVEEQDFLNIACASQGF